MMGALLLLLIYEAIIGYNIRHTTYITPEILRKISKNVKYQHQIKSAQNNNIKNVYLSQHINEQNRHRVSVTQ